jgi:hypothetical protein
MDNKEILTHSLEYFKRSIPDFKITARGVTQLFTCPICNTPNAGSFITTYSNKIVCRGGKCNKIIGTLIDIVKAKENYKDDNEALENINKVLGLGMVFKEEIDYILSFYEMNGWDMTESERGGKGAFEHDWGKISHKNKIEWEDWLRGGSNISVKSGPMSNLTIIDVDTKVDVPEILKKYLTKDYLYQESLNGYHLFFKFTKDLPEKHIKIDSLKIELFNGNSSKIVVFPSKVDDYVRRFNFNIKEHYNVIIPEMPQELKDYLLTNIKANETKSSSSSEKNDNLDVKLDEEAINEDWIKTYKENLIKDGNRSNTLTSIGGIFRQEFSINDTTKILNIINHRLCEKPLNSRELATLSKSLEKYTGSDIKENATKTLKYLKIVEEASARDVKEALGFPKVVVDKCLAYLQREEYIIKKKQYFRLVKKIQWRTEFANDGKPITYNTPYFHHVARIRSGDLIVVGGKTSIGKSHISINMIKKVVEQGIVPYYISLESGSRFVSIAKSLNLKEKDFLWTPDVVSPFDVMLEKDAFTIFDWLLPDDYADTDKIYKHLSTQLVKNGGVLIVFVQLKENGEFFAQNMIKNFASVACKYFYTKDDDGSEGYFQVEKMRESLINRKTCRIPCKYNWQTKELEITEGSLDENISSKDNK